MYFLWFWIFRIEKTIFKFYINARDNLKPFTKIDNKKRKSMFFSIVNPPTPRKITRINTNLENNKWNIAN